MDLEKTETKELLRKYFHYWYKVYYIKKEKREMISDQIDQKQKLDTLLKALKKYKKGHPKTAGNQPSQKESKKAQKNCKSAHEGNYKKRCEIQKNTIQNLTNKLEAKDRIIDELKLGILEKASREAALETRFEIREIFADCSVKTRCKIAPPPEYNEQFMIATQKAPKILHEMETRALERAKKHEIILERKRIIEETRKRIAREIVEKKRVQDEDEKKRNLQLIQEQRRKQLELEKKRKERKLIFMEQFQRAVNFHTTKLLQRGFNSFRRNYSENIQNYIKSVKHYRKNLLLKTINHWKEFVEAKYYHKYAAADQLYEFKVLTRTWQIFYMNREQSIRLHQVAEDFNEMRIQREIFLLWHRNVCKIIVSTEKKMRIAQEHHNRKLLFHIFYQWRSFPAVMQLERAKAQKMKKWREKVWEILPDYKPPED